MELKNSQFSPRETHFAWWVVFFAVLFHLAALRLPFVNLEWAFVDAAKYFETGNNSLLERYFTVQANTLGTSLLAYAIHSILPFLPLEILPRLLSIAGFIFLGSALLRINSLLGTQIPPSILVACVFLNPLIWIFGGRGTADFLSPCLALFSISLFWNRPKGYRTLWPIIFFGVAIALKYHAALLLPMIFLDILVQSQKNLMHGVMKCLAIGAGTLSLPLAFVLWTYDRFGFWFTPPDFQSIHAIEFVIPQILFAATSYLGYLALMLFPLSLAVLIMWNKSLRGFLIFAAAATFFFCLGFYFLASSGEMNFGPLDGKLDHRTINGFFAVGSGLFLAILWSGRVFYLENSISRVRLVIIAFTLLFFVGVLAFSRPAQRYLIFLLPLVYFFVLPTFNNLRWLTFSTLLLSALMNVYLIVNQFHTGAAAVLMVERLESKKLISETDPGIIRGHIGNRFLFDNIPKKYSVVAGTTKNELFSVESGSFPWLKKTYALIPIQ